MSDSVQFTMQKESSEKLLGDLGLKRIKKKLSAERQLKGRSFALHVRPWSHPWHCKQNGKKKKLVHLKIIDKRILVMTDDDGHIQPRTTQKYCQCFCEFTPLSDWEDKLKEFHERKSAVNLYIEENPCTANILPLILFEEILNSAKYYFYESQYFSMIFLEDLKVVFHVQEI